MDLTEVMNKGLDFEIVKPDGDRFTYIKEKGPNYQLFYDTINTGVHGTHRIGLHAQGHISEGGVLDLLF